MLNLMIVNLIDYYGGLTELAKALGITPRHLRRIRKTPHAASNNLEKLIYHLHSLNCKKLLSDNTKKQSFVHKVLGLFSWGNPPKT